MGIFKSQQLFAGATRTLAYIPDIAIMLGSSDQAIMLCQLLFWHGKEKRKGYIIKSQDEMHHETGLTRSQQQTARRCLQEAGLITASRTGNAPPTLAYQLHIERIEQRWWEYMESKKARFSQMLAEAEKDPLRQLPPQKIANRSALKLRKEMHKRRNESAAETTIEVGTAGNAECSYPHLNRVESATRWVENAQSYPNRDDSIDDAADDATKRFPRVINCFEPTTTGEREARLRREQQRPRRPRR